MSKRNRVKKTTVVVPEDIDEAAKFIKWIGDSTQMINYTKYELDRKIAELTADAMDRISPHVRLQKQRLDGLYIFAESCRGALTRGGKKKTVKLPTGSIAWRFTPPAVSIKNAERVMKQIETLGLKGFIRVKKTIDKEALLKRPEQAKSIPGVKISQREEFVVTPRSSKIEVAKRLKKPCKKKG